MPSPLRSASLLVIAPLCFAACSAASPADDTHDVAVDDPSVADTGLSSSFAIGTTLRTTADLNLRKGPSTSHAVLRVMPEGALVTVVEPKPVDQFYHVTWDGVDGWCSGRYLEFVSSPGGNPDDGAPWSCTGSYGTTPVAGGRYYATSFGCWVDADGNAHADSGDNCIPGCLAQARSAGLCAGSSGPACERSVNWYAADAGRYGCLARLRVTNPANGRSAVVVVLDYGPACWVERSVGAGIVDLSSAVTEYLFGGARGASDRAEVTVTEVPSSTPLGPAD